MTISYAITVCNEEDEIITLIEFLLQRKREDDEICVLLDVPKATKHIQESLWNYNTNKKIVLRESAFTGHFADWKNELTNMCSGDYIFQIDADELPDSYLVESLFHILTTNKGVDVFWVPRINTVRGITSDHIKQWNWNVDYRERVNFPDYQCRIFKNVKRIRWKNKVHEVLTGHQTEAKLPVNDEYCLYHHKTIERQERQNQLYDSYQNDQS